MRVVEFFKHVRSSSPQEEAFKCRRAMEMSKPYVLYPFGTHVPRIMVAGKCHQTPINKPDFVIFFHSRNDVVSNGCDDGFLRAWYGRNKLV